MRCPSTYVIALRRLGGPPLQIQALPQFIDPTIDAKAENGSVEALPQKRKGKGPADGSRDCALKIIIPGVNFRRGRADNRVPLKNQWEQRDLPASEQAVVNQEGKKISVAALDSTASVARGTRVRWPS